MTRMALAKNGRACHIIAKLTNRSFERAPVLAKPVAYARKRLKLIGTACRERQSRRCTAGPVEAMQLYHPLYDDDGCVRSLVDILWRGRGADLLDRYGDGDLSLASDQAAAAAASSLVNWPMNSSIVFSP
jgi:hypothetical protein